MSAPTAIGCDELDTMSFDPGDGTDVTPISANDFHIDFNAAHFDHGVPVIIMLKLTGMN
jgi:hypothetical protein